MPCVARPFQGRGRGAESPALLGVRRIPPRPGRPAAHVRIYLALLPSGPDAVHRLRLHRFRAAVQSVVGRVYYVCYTATRVASSRYFASTSPTTTVKKSTYKIPVADCVDRILAVSQVRYDSTAGPNNPNRIRCQKNIPPIEKM